MDSPIDVYFNMRRIYFGEANLSFQIDITQ